MLFMVLLALRIDQDIVYEDNHKLIQVRSTYSVHQIHKDCWSVRQTERHDQEFVVTITSSECCLGNIFLSNSHLMVSGSRIDFGEVCRSLQLVEQIINTRKRITILDSNLVQLPIIDAHAKRSIFLFDEQHGGSPRRRAGSNESLIQQLLKLIRQLLHLGWC